jgi:hypothetical protein
MKAFRIILWVQTLYYFITAAWALVVIKSFMEITGPKADVWLVKTVSVLLLAISFCFLANLFIKSNPWPAIILAGGCCIFLAFIDFYYAGKQTISAVYFLDGIAEVLLLLVWLFVIFKLKKSPPL